MASSHQTPVPQDHQAAGSTAAAVLTTEILTPLDGDGHEVLQGPVGVVPETMRPPKRLLWDVVLVTLCQMQSSWFEVYDTYRFPNIFSDLSLGLKNRQDRSRS